jgi:hypothetical protein
MLGQLLVQHQRIGGNDKAGETDKRQPAAVKRRDWRKHEADAKHNAPKGNGGWLIGAERKGSKRCGREQHP